jgi:hypothetical protein
MKNLVLVFEAIFAFIISYLSVFAALTVLPSFMGVLVNIFSGDFQNAGTLFSYLVCAVVLSSSMIYKHLKSVNIIEVK